MVAVLEEQPAELDATTETPLELTAPVFPQRTSGPATAKAPRAEEAFPLPLAGVGRRLLARFLLLVGLVLMVALGFGIIILGGSALRRDLAKDKTIAALVVAVPPAIYLLVNAAMLARSGQDIGKRYAGVRVVNADGSKATEMTALIKRDALTFVIGLTGIGVLYWLADFVTLFGKGGRTLHDRIAGTRVVRA